MLSIKVLFFALVLGFAAGQETQTVLGVANMTGSTPADAGLVYASFVLIVIVIALMPQWSLGRLTGTIHVVYAASCPQMMLTVLGQWSFTKL